MNQITHRAVYRTISIKDTDAANLPLIPDLRYKNLTGVFGVTPKESQRIEGDEALKTKSIDKTSGGTQSKWVKNETKRFRNALRDISVPLKDRWCNPYRGNLEKEMARYHEFDFTLD